MEAGEKREHSGSPKAQKHPLLPKKEKRKDRHPPRPNKLDRNSIAKGMKVPLAMNSVPYGKADLFSGAPNHASSY